MTSPHFCATVLAQAGREESVVLFCVLFCFVSFCFVLFCFVLCCVCLESTIDPKRGKREGCVECVCVCVFEKVVLCACVYVCLFCVLCFAFCILRCVLF